MTPRGLTAPAFFMEGGGILPETGLPKKEGEGVHPGAVQEQRGMGYRAGPLQTDIPGGLPVQTRTGDGGVITADAVIYRSE
jgi:hypothetical protein